MKKHGVLTTRTKYKKFIYSRDQLLESMLHQYIRAMTLGLDELFSKVREITVGITMQVGTDLHTMKRFLNQFEQRLEDDFDSFHKDLIAMIKHMRKSVYAVSAMGQAEAIGLTTGKTTHYQITKSLLDGEANKELDSGQSMDARVWRALTKLRSKLVSEFQMGLLMEETPSEMLDRINRSLPKRVIVKRPKRVLKSYDKMQEAVKKGYTPFATGFVDDETWNQIVKSYLKKEVPFFGERTATEEYYEEHGKYEWEFEQELTDDFVQRVRDGEVDTANKNGVTDMIWIAIVDDRTDDCCLIRDGKTSQEIEDALDNGDMDDECDAVVPPAHTNCRCRVAPYYDEIPEEEPPSDADFWGWLDDKAKDKI